MASSSLGEGSDNGEFSVLVLGSDLTVDARSFLEPLIPEEHEVWHECLEEEDFSDIEQLQTVRIEGTDRHGNRIIRIVGKFFPGIELLMDDSINDIKFFDVYLLVFLYQSMSTLRLGDIF